MQIINLKNLLKTGIVAAILSTGQSSQCATLIWNGPDGGGGPVDGSGTWDTNLLNNVTNWWNALTSVNTAWTNAIANVAVIGNGTGAAGTITVATNVLTAGLTFNPAGSGNYTLTGGIITNSGPINFNSSVTLNTPLYNTGAITFGAPVTIGGTAAITNAGTVTMTTSATINNSVITTGAQTWSGSNDVLNVASLTPISSGALVFSGSNAPSGFGPQFNIGSFNGTGFTGSLFVSNGATLNINGGNWTNSGSLIVRPTTIGQSAGGPSTSNGLLTLNLTGGRLYNTGSVTLGGSLSNALGTNVINISGGTLIVAGSGSLVGQVNGQNYFTVSGNGTYIDLGTTYFCIGNIGTGPATTGFSSYGGCVPVTTVAVTNNGTMIFSNTSSIAGVIANAGSGCEILLSREANQAAPSGGVGNPNGSLICQSTLRFDGGTFKTGRAILPSGANTTGATNIVYFNSGLFEPILPCPNSNNMIQGITHSYVGKGGANINNNGISWGMSQPLETDPTLTNADGGLTVNGAGALTLNGTPNTYTGPTTIGSGSTLVLNGDLSGGGTVSVLAGGTLTGSANMSGGLVVYGGGTVSPAYVAGAGTLNVASLQLGLSSADVLTNNFDATLNSPLISVANTFTNKGTTVINIIGPAPNAGTYTLIQYGSEVKGPSSGFVLGSITYGAVGAYIQDTGTAIQLVVPSYVGEPIQWAGTNTGTWTTLTNAIDWLGVNSGNSTFYYNTATVQFNSTTTNSTVTMAGNVNPFSVTLAGSDNYLFTGIGGIADAIGLTTPVTINGPGYVTFANANTYSGGTVINGGALVITNGGSISQGIPSVGIQDNATFAFNRTDTSTFANWITGGGQLVKQGSGTVTLTATNNFAGGTIVSNGTLALGIGSAFSVNGTVSGTMTVMTNATLTTTVQDAFGYGGNCVTALNVYGGTVLNTAGNYQDLWGNFGMAVSLYGGTLLTSNASSSFNIGNTSTINTYPSASLSSIISTNTGGQFELRQATTYIGVARGTAPVDFLINAPIVQISGVVGGIDVSGGGIMAVAGTSTYAGGTSIESGTVLQVGYGALNGNLGAAAGSVNDSGTLVFASPGIVTIPNVIGGSGNVTKIGTGETILTGSSTYNGPTVVTSGQLAFSGAGQNTGGGSMEVQAGGTLVHLGNASSMYSTLNLDSSSSNAFSLPTAPDSISGAITVGSGSGPATILIINAGTSNGLYNLISYGSLSGLGLSGLNLAFANPSAAGTLTTNAAGTMLQVNVTSTGAINWNGNLGTTPAWDLSGSNQWDYSGTTTATGYTDGSTVVFIDGATKYGVAITTNVSPASVTIQATNTFTFTGAGSISGSTGLVQNGPGVLAVGNSNSFSGGTTINGGTLQLTNSGILAGAILDDSVFELSMTNTNGVILGNLIAGTGSLLNHGPGIVTVTNHNTYTGGTTNSVGTLEYNSANPAPFGPGDIYLTDGATGTGAASLLGVSVNTGTAARYTFTNNIWVPQNSGTAIFGATNSAALVFNSGVFYTGNINISTNVTILTQNAEVYCNGTINGTGNITVNGTGRAIVNVPGDANFTGDVYVTNGAGVQVLNAVLGATRNYHLVSPASSIILQGSLSLGAVTGTGNIVEYPSTVGVVTVGNGDVSFTFSGGIQPGTWASIPGCTVSGIGLVKTGAGVFTFAGSGSYGSGTEVSGGAMLVNGTLNGNGVLVDAGATFGGNGTVTDPVTVNGILSPGPTSTGVVPSVGALATGTETWNGGGSYMFGMSNATSSTGADLLNVTGSLNIMSASTNVFTIDLVTLTPAGVAGPMANFNKALNYSWPIATVSGGIVNFNRASFVLNTSGFANDFSSAGTFSLDVIGNSLVVNYISTTLAAPTVTGGAVSGGKFVLSFTGPNSQDYTVLTSTNLTLPLPQWTVVATGTFGAGASTYTNAAPTAKEQFYIIESP